MRFYNFNTKSINTWKHYQKNYITPFSFSVNSLFDYILNFNPDYDILNKDNREELLKDNYNFMKDIGFYWASDQIIKLEKQSNPKKDDFEEEITINDQTQKIFNSQLLDIRQGWIFHYGEGVFTTAEDYSNKKFIQPRDGDIFIKTAPEGQYGGYWIPQGNMGLYLPTFNSNQLIFKQQKYEEDSAEWDFNFDIDIFRFICSDISLQGQTTFAYNNITNSMIWSVTEEDIKKNWTGQPVIPQIVSTNQEEIITDARFVFDQTYQKKRYYSTLTVNLNKIEIPCHLQVC